MPLISTTATAVMLLTNVGLQLFNNWRNAQTNEKITRKQQEFQRAAQGHNHDRMMELLREGQSLQQQWETENHEQRLKNINDDFDTLINQTFFQYALQNSWPLTVLPMVMKNQSLGSFRTNSNENIALHVILTPSNSTNFNNAVFPQIELGLEAFFQRHWNTMSSHPVIFYSGAWKSATAPTENDIALLRTHLKSLPILMVTPYFQPDGKKELVFNINMWGMGNTQQTTSNNIDLSQQITIQPSEQEFSYYKIYAPTTAYSDELKATTIEEFVPYLQCMIGYLADVYFWSAHNRPPILPTLLTIGAVNTDGMKYLVDNAHLQYSNLLNNDIKGILCGDEIFKEDNRVIDLYKGIKMLWDDDSLNQLLNKAKQQSIDIEFIYLENLQSICEYINLHQKEFFEPTDFIFTLWNDDVIIGTFVNQENVAALTNNLCYRYYIFYKNEPYSLSPLPDIEYYKYNINLSKITQMEKKKENPVSKYRERLGEILIKHGEYLRSKRTIGEESAQVSDVWGVPRAESNASDYTLEDFCNFFVSAINEQKVAAETIDSMSISVVLDWLEQLNLSNIDADRLYLLKHYVNKYQRYMYCAFLGNGKSVLLDDLKLTKCYISKVDSPEMKDLFQNKPLYVVPFEK